MEILLKTIIVLLPLIAVIYFIRMYRKTGVGLNFAYIIGAIISLISAISLNF